MGNCSYSTIGNFMPKESFLSLMHVNYRSLNKIWLEFLSYCLHYRPSVIALSETLLKEGDEQNLCLPEYVLVSDPRLNIWGGGTDFYVDSSLIFFLLEINK